jgi:hypothetical protein
MAPSLLSSAEAAPSGSLVKFTDNSALATVYHLAGNHTHSLHAILCPPPRGDRVLNLDDSGNPSPAAAGEGIRVPSVHPSMLRSIARLAATVSAPNIAVAR